MGGPIQPPGHVQTMVRLLDLRNESAGRARRAAMEAERRQVDRPRDSASPELRAGLIALGHELAAVADSYMDFGAGQIIVRTEGGYAAASDPRRDGQAAGF